MAHAIENILFTSFIGLVVVVALFISLDWPVRASIVILLLGSIGIVLTAIQLVFDLKVLRGDMLKAARPTFEVEALEHQGRWGSLEIWAWLWGLYSACPSPFRCLFSFTPNFMAEVGPERSS